MKKFLRDFNFSLNSAKLCWSRDGCLTPPIDRLDYKIERYKIAVKTGKLVWDKDYSEFDMIQ